MAIIKRRIMSRSRILSVIYGDTEKTYHLEQEAHADIAAHMLADGKEVKIFHDVNMGGTVVEYDDGK